MERNKEIVQKCTLDVQPLEQTTNEAIVIVIIKPLAEGEVPS